MNKFEKVSFKEFKNHFINNPYWTHDEIEEAYKSIKLPCRSTNGSAQISGQSLPLDSVHNL